MTPPPSAGPAVLRPPLDAAARSRLRQALASGEVMAYPTETFYALGGNALHPTLAARVLALKRRSGDKALLLLVTPAQVPRLATDIAPAARALMAACWPGPLTLVLRAADDAPPHLRDARGTVALRCSPHPLLGELLSLGGVPLIGTSANVSGDAPAASAAAVQQAFPAGIDLLLDGGPTAGGAPSTLLDTTVRPFAVLRRGALAVASLRRVLLPDFAADAPEDEEPTGAEGRATSSRQDGAPDARGGASGHGPVQTGHGRRRGAPRKR
ncbi:MAG: threonylcarbamoyl-AMP synthase [Candidatus Lambdaproteobacteria bacterium]|nr:threonylcarbamoyl-AMP synthase [Candidatus Lambdaproteobacteria bacterium]